MTIVDADTGEVLHGELVPLPADPSELDALTDPEQAITRMCEQGHEWLERAVNCRDFDGITDIKAKVAMLAEYAKRRQLGRDSVLVATEVIRRAECGLATAVRAAQAGGDLPTKGQHPQPGSVSSRLRDLFISPAEQKGAYLMVDGVPPGAFDRAIVAARADRDLSRTNLLRRLAADPAVERPEPEPSKAKREGGLDRSPAARTARMERIKEMSVAGHNSQQIAAELHIGEGYIRSLCREMGVQTADMKLGNQHRIDAGDVLHNLCQQVEPDPVVIGLLAYGDMDTETLSESLSSLGCSIKSLQTIKRNIEKELKDRD